VTWQLSTILGIVLGAIVPEELGLSFTIPLTFISLLVSEFRKSKHIIVILVSGCVALLAYNMPFKAYIIVAAIAGLSVAAFLNREKS
jgi:predicted branched-subunit amino acid permease